MRTGSCLVTAMRLLKIRAMLNQRENVGSGAKHRPDSLLLLAAGIIAVGAGLRLHLFFANRSLWLDEAMLAINLVRRTPAELLLPLDYAQGAPLGFLYAQKLIIMLAGSSEPSLRTLLGGALVIGAALAAARRR